MRGPTLLVLCGLLSLAAFTAAMQAAETGEDGSTTANSQREVGWASSLIPPFRLRAKQQEGAEDEEEAEERRHSDDDGSKDADCETDCQKECGLLVPRAPPLLPQIDRKFVSPRAYEWLFERIKECSEECGVKKACQADLLRAMHEPVTGGPLKRFLVSLEAKKDKSDKKAEKVFQSIQKLECKQAGILFQTPVPVQVHNSAMRLAYAQALHPKDALRNELEGFSSEVMAVFSASQLRYENQQEKQQREGDHTEHEAELDEEDRLAYYLDLEVPPSLFVTTFRKLSEGYDAMLSQLAALSRKLKLHSKATPEPITRQVLAPAYMRQYTGPKPNIVALNAQARIVRLKKEAESRRVAFLKLLQRAPSQKIQQQEDDARDSGPPVVVKAHPRSMVEDSGPPAVVKAHPRSMVEDQARLLWQAVDGQDGQRTATEVLQAKTEMPRPTGTQQDEVSRSFWDAVDAADAGKGKQQPPSPVATTRGTPSQDDGRPRFALDPQDMLARLHAAAANSKRRQQMQEAEAAEQRQRMQEAEDRQRQEAEDVERLAAQARHEKQEEEAVRLQQAVAADLRAREEEARVRLQAEKEAAETRRAEEMEKARLQEAEKLKEAEEARLQEASRSKQRAVEQLVASKLALQQQVVRLEASLVELQDEDDFAGLTDGLDNADIIAATEANLQTVLDAIQRINAEIDGLDLGNANASDDD